MKVQPGDIAGFSQLTSDAVVGTSKLIEAVQAQLALVSCAVAPVAQVPVLAIAGLVHKTVRGITRAVDRAVQEACDQDFREEAREQVPCADREGIIAVLNGVIGDHLAATGNPLAIQMRLRRNGRPLEITKDALRAALPEATRKLLVMVHGLCRNDLQWEKDGHDYGAALARDLGYTPLYLHYNSGLHISENGQTFADLLRGLVLEWPEKLEELVLLGYSAGGLVSRSACYYGTIADHDWRRYLRHLIFIGTPHHGTPLEQLGNLVNVGLDLGPFLAPYSCIAKIRSAGITDLRYGNVRQEDWQKRDRFTHSPDVRTPLPLPDGVRCHTIAAASAKKGTSTQTGISGDGIVPLDSALGRHPDPAMTLRFARTQQWIGYEMNHRDLLCHAAVYQRICHWLRN